MDREQKAVVVDRIAEELGSAEAVLAVDYRGITVPEAAELRTSLREADARFSVVKNRLTLRALEKADATALSGHLAGPTALTFVHGDVAQAAKAIAGFIRAHEKLAFKGGLLNGEPLDADQIMAIARLPARDQLNAQLAGVVASPLTGLVRGLASMLSGLASQLEQIRAQGLVGGDAPAGEAEAPQAEPEPSDEEAAASADEPEAPAGEPEAEAGAEKAAAETSPPEEGGDETEGDDQGEAKSEPEED